ncbi:MAG TPA: ATP-binding protein [bacterium]|nr:ATP-binding protein [bacterium]
MLGYDLIVLLGFFVGAILYSVLFAETLKRQNKLKHEYVFLVFVAILTFWHGFQFLGMLIKQVFGRPALEIYSELRYISLYAIAFFPPLVVHLHASFLEYVLNLINRRSRILAWFPYIMYAPILAILYFSQYTIIDGRRRILDEGMSFIPPYVFWLIVCLLVSGFLSSRIIRLSRNEKWRQFFIVELIITIVISVLLVYFYFYGGTGNVRLDRSLKNMIMISSLIPTGAMVYLLYKYPFYSTVARRRFLLITISGVFLVVFIMSSKALRKMAEENPELNVEFLEIVLVSMLFLVYEPTKYLVRRIAGQFALHEKSYFQSLIRKITEHIVSAANLAELTKAVRTGIVDALHVEEVGLYTLNKTVSGERTLYSIVHAYGDIKTFNLEKITRHIQKGNGLYDARKMNIFHLRSAEVPYQIYLGIVLDNELVGILAIGKKKSNEDFEFEEKELLLTVASQVAISIENIQLLQRRIELESKMFEADKLTSLGMLSTSIAHEVKNPLSSIKSIVQSMHDQKKKENTDTEAIQDLEIINEEIDRLSSVVNQLLRFARSDSSGMDRIDIIKIIDAILTISRQETRVRNIRIFTRYDHAPLVIRSRQGDLKEIIFNLIINAIQSMPEGGRLMIHGAYVQMDANYFIGGAETEVGVFDKLYPDDPSAGWTEWSSEAVTAKKIEAIKKDPGTEIILPPEAGKTKCLRIAITDTGHGIPPERLGEIFKPFFTTKSEGTGLGLAIVKNKIQALGGRLVLRSELQVGTSFEVYIPSESTSRS